MHKLLSSTTVLALSLGLAGCGQTGTNTEKHLSAQFEAGSSAPTALPNSSHGADVQAKMSAWFDMQMGVTEIEGDKHNPDILAWHKLTTLAAKTDETPWCSSAMNAAAEYAGVKGTRSAAARSWLEWGVPVERRDAREDDLVILKRGNSETFGHVALLVSFSADGQTVWLKGGNQGNAVSVKPYPAADIIGIRRAG